GGGRETRALPPFPTRRSSDLDSSSPPICGSADRYSTVTASFGADHRARAAGLIQACHSAEGGAATWRSKTSVAKRLVISRPAPRSEEHTSELQSRENLVCRLL